MLISSLINEKFFLTLKLLIANVNKHVDLEEYAIIIARFNLNKKKIKHKAYLSCNRKKKIKEKEREFN